MREIATRAGIGRISSSTVHNVFRTSRVPRWNVLDEIVTALGGDTAVFLALWQSAWHAENATETPPDRLLDMPQRSPGPPESGAYQRIWSGEIPPRNVNFTGRVATLAALRGNLIGRGRQHASAQVISGMAGVGKTEIAAEYIHLHRDEYEVIWWIHADHHDRVRDALVKLSQRLGLPSAIPGSGRDWPIAEVLKALESGIRPNWLLVYDNVMQPLDLQRGTCLSVHRAATSLLRHD